MVEQRLRLCPDRGHLGLGAAAKHQRDRGYPSQRDRGDHHQQHDAMTELERGGHLWRLPRSAASGTPHYTTLVSVASPALRAAETTDPCAHASATTSYG